MKARLLVLGSVATVATVGTSVLAAPTSYTRPGNTERVSVTSGGVQASYPSTTAAGLAGGPQADVSADGRYVAFQSFATNLVPGDTNGGSDIFWRDRKTGVTKRASIASDGSQARSATQLLVLPGQTPNAPTSTAPSISADGRYVAFMSTAVNLVAGDTNGFADVFVHDMRTGRTIRVSVTSGGGQSVGSDANYPMISRSGRLVAFGSQAANLLPHGSSVHQQVFVHDLRSGTTKIASVSSSGVPADEGTAAASISGDGRYVAFQSGARNLVSHDTTALDCACGAQDVFWHDMKTGKTVRVSVASDGSQASFASFPSCTFGTPALLDLPPLPYPVPRFEGEEKNLCGSYLSTGGRAGRSLSDDGRYVIFTSNATNLVPNDGNYGPAVATNAYNPLGLDTGMDVFVHDVLTHRTERVSVDQFGHERGQNGVFATMSDDGRFVAYEHADSAEDQVCTPYTCSVRVEAFAYDRLAGAMDWLSPSYQGGQAKPSDCGDGVGVYSQVSGMSRDGRVVSFGSTGTDLVPGDTNGACDVFVRDRGRVLGTDGLAANGSLGVQESSGSSWTGMIANPSPMNVDAVVANRGGDLFAAQVVRRTKLADLFVRLDASHMPRVTDVTSAAGLLYGLDLTANGVRYEVRIQRTLGGDFDPAGGASFGLFREAAPGVWTHVASLKGGYGTIGDAVVTAVPLSLLGGKAQLTDVTAYTAIGSYVSGATKVLDSLRLSR